MQATASMGPAHILTHMGHLGQRASFWHPPANHRLLWHEESDSYVITKTSTSFQ